GPVPDARLRPHPDPRPGDRRRRRRHAGGARGAGHLAEPGGAEPRGRVCLRGADGARAAVQPHVERRAPHLVPGPGGPGQPPRRRRSRRPRMNAAAPTDDATRRDGDELIIVERREPPPSQVNDTLVLGFAIAAALGAATFAVTL